jgi:hypothetical protein
VDMLTSNCQNLPIVMFFTNACNWCSGVNKAP